MVRSEELFLQVRMRPLSSGQKATVISAVVCGRFNSSSIQVQLSKLGGIDLFFDGIKFDLTHQLPITEMFVDTASVTVNDERNVVRISFEQGLTVTVGQTSDALSVETSASPHLQTSGLLGNNRDQVRTRKNRLFITNEELFIPLIYKNT
jgi:hypothetical protein